MKTYQFLIGKRIININAENQIEAESKAIDWKNAHANNCIVSYYCRIK